MASSSESRRGTYLPTGWRIVGPGAERIAERAMNWASKDRLREGRAEDTLYAVEFTASPTVGGRPTVERALDAMAEEIRRTWEDCPRLSRDEEVERTPSRFGGLRYRTHSDPGREWVGEALWRAVHPRVPGAPVTTRVLLEERPGFTRVGVRVSADDGLASVRGHVGAGQGRPAFLEALGKDVTPSWMGAPLDTHPIRAGDEEHFIRSVLESTGRRIPVVVLSPLEEGGHLIDPDALAWELFGRAVLHVMTRHQQSFALTDAIGDRRMSCYWGAARCYMPGWSRHDDFHDHPLLIGDRLLDPVMRAAWLGEIGVWTGSRVELRASLDERFGDRDGDGDRHGDGGTGVSGGATVVAEAETGGAVEPSTPEGAGEVAETAASKTAAAGAASPEPEDAARVRTDARTGEVIEEVQDGEASAGDAPERGESARPSAAEPSPILRALVDEVRAMASLLDGVLSTHGELVDEVERLRTISSLRSSSTNAIERRLGRLEDILERVSEEARLVRRDPTADPAAERPAPGGEEDDEGALTLPEVVHEAAQSHADELVFLDAAFEAAGDSPYEDPERVRAILDAMARVSRRRQEGVLGTSLREAFGDLGVDYRGAIAKSTPTRLREQYRFTYGNERVEAEEHIVLGNTYDPRRCLRIYFSSRVPSETRFVIGHVGRHFQVITST